AIAKWGVDGPFESVHKLNLIVTRCNKDKKLINWVLHAIIDLCLKGTVQCGEVTFKNLKDGIGGNKGLIDVLIMKKQIRDHLIHGKYLAVYGTPKLQSYVQEVFSSHAVYRTKVEPLNDDMEVDLSWKMSAKDVEKKMFQLTGDVVFSSEYDPQLRYCCRKSKSIEEVMEHNGIKEDIDKVWEAQVIAQESTKRKDEEELDACGTAPVRKRQTVDQEEDGVMVTPSLEDPADKHAVEAWYYKHAKKKVLDNVKLVCDSGKSEAALQTTISQTAIGTEEGAMTGHVLIHPGVTLTGEPVTAPHIRTAPYRKEQVSRLRTAVINARRKSISDSKRLNQGDVYVYLDGGKKGTGDRVNKVMVTTKGRWKVACQSEGVAKNTTNLLFEESSLKNRRALVRGVSALKQLQTMHFYHTSDATIPEKKRSVYPGSNNGNVMGPVAYESWESSWKMTVGEKLKFYGPNPSEVGGKTIDGEEKASDCESVEVDETGGADLDSAEKPEFDVPLVGGGRGSGRQMKQAVEPVRWHALPREFYKEITSSYYIKTVIDLTPGNGNFALHCIQNGIGYLGVCFQNEEHKAMLTEHLIKEYMILMKTEGNKHYHASYAKHLVGVATSGPGDEDEAAKRKATAAAKKAAAAA
ncbi:unnamed protein product, partial [Prorocentrum cordatum]